MPISEIVYDLENVDAERIERSHQVIHGLCIVVEPVKKPDAPRRPRPPRTQIRAIEETESQSDGGTTTPPVAGDHEQDCEETTPLTPISEEDQNWTGSEAIPDSEILGKGDQPLASGQVTPSSVGSSSILSSTLDAAERAAIKDSMNVHHIICRSTAFPKVDTHPSTSEWALWKRTALTTLGAYGRLDEGMSPAGSRRRGQAYAPPAQDRAVREYAARLMASSGIGDPGPRPQREEG